MRLTFASLLGDNFSPVITFAYVYSTSVHLKLDPCKNRGSMKNQESLKFFLVNLLICIRLAASTLASRGFAP